MQPHRNLQLPPPENSSFPTLSFSRRPHHLTRPQRTRSTCAQSTLCHLARCERASHTENAPTQETSQPDVLRSPRLNVANEAHRESRRFIQALCGYSSRRPTWSCRTRCRHHHGPARSDTPVRPCTSAQRQPPSRLCSWGSRHCPALAPVRAQARVPKRLTATTLTVRLRCRLEFRNNRLRRGFGRRSGHRQTRRRRGRRRGCVTRRRSRSRRPRRSG